MIRSIRHKGLRSLYANDSASGVPPDQIKRLRRILAVLDSAECPADLQGLPGLRPHPLKGRRRGEWALAVSGNWRVVFRFEGEDVVDVDLVDYH